MSADYSPGIPGETITQILDSLDELQKVDMDYDELGNHIFSAMGNLRIDSEGVNLIGDFGTMGINSEEFAYVKEAALKAVDFGLEMLPHIRGKQFILKNGNSATKFKIGLIPRIVTATDKDLADDTIPVIEIKLDEASETPIDVLIHEVTKRVSNDVEPKASGIKFHRLEEFAGWLPTWKEFGDMMNVAIPLLALTKMKTLKRISASMPDLLSDVLNRCGEGKKKQ